MQGGSKRAAQLEGTTRINEQSKTESILPVDAAFPDFFGQGGFFFEKSVERIEVEFQRWHVAGVFLRREQPGCSPCPDRAWHLVALNTRLRRADRRWLKCCINEGMQQFSWCRIH